MPLEKDIGADGILLASGEHSTSSNDTDDANTTTRHGENWLATNVMLATLILFCIRAYRCSCWTGRLKQVV